MAIGAASAYDRQVAKRDYQELEHKAYRLGIAAWSVPANAGDNSVRKIKAAHVLVNLRQSSKTMKTKNILVRS